MYAVFDFDSVRGMEFSEFHILYCSILYAVCKLTGSLLPSKIQIEKDAKTVILYF